MTKHEIKLVLSKIVNDYVNLKLDNRSAVAELIEKLNPEEIYDIDDDSEIVDCYFAIKHLCEEGYETTFTEIKYFDECFSGSREYAADEKNKYILASFK